MNSLSHPNPLCVDIYWDAQILSGVAFTVVDVLKMINRVAAMRSQKAPDPVCWRWRALGAEPVPRSLPAGSRSGKRLAHVAIVPGWHAQSGPHLDQLVRNSTGTLPALQALHRAGGRLAAVYNGSALLAQGGLLDGVQAAVPWPFMASVLRQSDQVQITTDLPWVQGNRVWTCDSTIWITEMLLDLLRNIAHPSLQAVVESAAHVLLPTAGRQQVAALNVRGIHGQILPVGAVERARRWLEANLDKPYSLQATAQAAATSSRTLLRHFALAHGKTPLDYLHSLRIARAQVLLETSYVSVEQIAQMCGYIDVGTFRRLFVKALGQRPADYREHYRLRTSRKRWGENQVN
jgi:transcriptional regulator GlxA family with amidase domain